MQARPFALMFVSILVVFVGIAAAARAVDTADAVPYPDGFREWRLIKSGVMLEGHPSYAASGAIRHIYANPKGLAGYRSGTFDDGAVIAVEFLRAREEDKALIEGARHRLDVMVRDRKRYAATGGWGFESWTDGDEQKPRVGEKANAMCFECHSKQTTTSFVFSTLRP